MLIRSRNSSILKIQHLILAIIKRLSSYNLSTYMSIFLECLYRTNRYIPKYGETYHSYESSEEIIISGHSFYSALHFIILEWRVVLHFVQQLLFCDGNMKCSQGP